MVHKWVPHEGTCSNPNIIQCGVTHRYWNHPLAKAPLAKSSCSSLDP